MLTWAFEAEAERLMKKEALKRQDNKRHDESSDSSDAGDEWEDYEQTIVGEEESSVDSASASTTVIDSAGKIERLERRVDSMDTLLRTIASQVQEIHAARHD